MVTWMGSHLSHCLPFNFTFKGCTSPRPPLFSPHLSSLRARQAVHHRILCPAKEDSTLKCFFLLSRHLPQVLNLQGKRRKRRKPGKRSSTASRRLLLKHLQTRLHEAPLHMESQSCSRPLPGWGEARADVGSSGTAPRGAPAGQLREKCWGQRQGRGERAGGRRRIFFTCSRRKSWGLKSFGEHPHQSTMCLYWHLQPSLRFQLVTLRLLSTSVSQAWLFSRTVWKKDCVRQRRDRRPMEVGG